MCDERDVERWRNFIRRYSREGVQERTLRNVIKIAHASSRADSPMTITAIQEAAGVEQGSAWPYEHLGEKANYPEALVKALCQYVAETCTDDIELALVSGPMPNDHYRVYALLWLAERQLINCVVVDETTAPIAALEMLLRPPFGPVLGGRPMTLLIPQREIAPIDHPARQIRTEARIEYVIRAERRDRAPRPQTNLNDARSDLTFGQVLALARSDVALVRDVDTDRTETVAHLPEAPDLVVLAHPTTVAASFTGEERIQRTRALCRRLHALPPARQLLDGCSTEQILPRQTGTPARHFLLIKAVERLLGEGF